MGLLGDVLGGVCKLGFAIGKGIVTQAWNQACSQTQEINRVRRSSYGMSDQELLDGYRDTNNSVGTRVGYAAALKDRHRR